MFLSNTCTEIVVDGQIYYMQTKIVEKYARKLYFGEISFPTGEIVAQDPYSSAKCSSFVQRVEPGCYPLFIYTVVEKDEFKGVDRLLAYVSVEFKKDKELVYKVAKTCQKDCEFLSNSGFIGFMDKETYDGLQNFLKKQDCGWEMILDEMEENYSVNYSIGEIDFIGTKANLILFTAYEDNYIPYWGYNQRGDVCRLVVDLLVFEQE